MRLAGVSGSDSSAALFFNSCGCDCCVDVLAGVEVLLDSSSAVSFAYLSLRPIRFHAGTRAEVSVFAIVIAMCCRLFTHATLSYASV